MSIKENFNHEYEKLHINENTTGKESEEIQSYGFGVRHIQAILIFLSLSITYVSRAHLGVTIVAMVDPSANENVTQNNWYLNATEQSITQNLNESIVDTNYNASVPEYLIDPEAVNGSTMNSESRVFLNGTDSMWNVYRTYMWTKFIQEMVLGSYFLGYLLMTFVMGLVSQRWGGKLPLQIGLFVNGLLSIVAPWIAFWGGWKAMCLLRVVQGLSQSGLYPGTITLLANWVPPSERGSLTTYVFTGSVVGTVLAFQLGGILAESRWGWPSMFWVTGVLCLITCLLLTMYGAATPSQHKHISAAERNFILGNSQCEPAKKPPTPWLSILRSRHTWAGFATHVGSGVSFVFFLTQVPSYLHYILGLDVGKSGLLSSLPYIGSFVSSVAMGYISDFCTNRKIVSLKNSRIISNCIAAMGMAASMAALSFIDSTTLAVSCLVLGLVAHAGVHTGWMVNYIDLTPNYSGFLMATGNTFMNLCILAQPMVVSNIVTDLYNLRQWRIVLFMVSGVSFLTNLVFVMLMSSEVQPWNDVTPNLEDTHENELKTEMKME